MDALHEVTIYTDGGCSPNPGPGGWAALLRSGATERMISGAVADTTNQRMELTACIEALRALRFPCAVTLYTDSQYVVGLMTAGWKAKANHDLVRALHVEAARHRVTWVHVRGHAGDVDNARVDAEVALARAGFGASERSMR